MPYVTCNKPNNYTDSLNNLNINYYATKEELDRSINIITNNIAKLQRSNKRKRWINAGKRKRR